MSTDPISRKKSLSFQGQLDSLPAYRHVCEWLDSALPRADRREREVWSPGSGVLAPAAALGWQKNDTAALGPTGQCSIAVAAVISVLCGSA